jgi:Na+-translocating ferredoxin:NAD+ oxidoreductase subunit D
MSIKPNQVSHLMLKVLIALLPAIALSGMLLSAGIFVHLFLAVTTAIVSESVILMLRKRPLMPTLSDLSAVVTAVLLVLSVPVLAPWWISVLGSFFAIVIGKQLYGGLGHNPFNPAMVAYTFLLISFPQPMTAWLAFDAPSLSFNEIMRLIFHETWSVPITLDALTQATPLDTIKTH